MLIQNKVDKKKFIWNLKEKSSISKNSFVSNKQKYWIQGIFILDKDKIASQ